MGPCEECGREALLAVAGRSLVCRACAAIALEVPPGDLSRHMVAMLPLPVWQLTRCY